jgi:hypothetical protein
MAKKGRPAVPRFNGKVVDIFRDVLDAAEPRPPEEAARDSKKNYAQRLSEASAVWFASHLRSFFPEILPKPDGAGTESLARTGKGIKRLDVNYSTVQLGLGLGVSIKTLNYKDPKTQRYTKNPTRLDNELRAEAMDYHERQPFSVLVAIVLLPIDAASDGDPTRPKTSWSSFAQVVSVLRHRVGRASPRDEAQLFEAGFVGLYEHEGRNRGDVGFFDLTDAPPQFGKPHLMDIGPTVAQIVKIYDTRNRVKRPWDTEKAPVIPFKELLDSNLIPDEDEDDDEL